jgi:Prion-inhibition and propagation
MEFAGFVFGVAGLLGTFTACVDCFDFVRVGRSLGPDYQTAVIKLDVVRLRFTRWGAAAGIAQGDESTATVQLKSRLASPDEDFETIKRLLGEILRLFQESEKTSKKLALKDPAAETRADGIEDKTIHNLHEAMRNLALRRQKRSTLSQKMSWALHRKRDLNNLIEDLTELVSLLVELAPMKPQQELCRTELAEIDTDQNVAVLDDVLHEPIGENSTNIDDLLQEQVTETIRQRRGTMTTAVWKRSKVGDGSNVRQGNNVASDYRGEIPDQEGKYVVEDSELGKNVVFHQGNNYGGSI